jgi:hypothetical protein
VHLQISLFQVACTLLWQSNMLSEWVSYLHVHVVDCMWSLVSLVASVLFVNWIWLGPARPK